MQDLIVTLVQANQIWEDKEANYRNYSNILKSIKQPTDLIILPEMFDTGFSMNIQLAETWEKNASFDYLLELSAEYNAAIYTSMMVKIEDIIFNRGVFIFPTGKIETYDKRKSFSLGGEDKYYTPGNTETIVNFRDWKINLQICYDLRFPEIARNYEIDGIPKYDLLLYVANWPTTRIEHWNILLKARAIENQSYVIGVNRFGQDGHNLLYSGNSSIIDPLGKIECKLENQMIFTSTLSKLTLINTRISLPFLKDY